MITVCPAFCPSEEPATTVKFSDNTSTIFPLPSSPHWAPTITAVLPLFNSKLRQARFTQADNCAAPGVAHSLPAGIPRLKNSRDRPEKTCTSYLIVLER